MLETMRPTPASGAAGTERTGTSVQPVLKGYDRLDDIPFAAANALLLDHAKMMHGRMVGSGGPDFDYHAHVGAFWAKIDEVLPPKGRYYLALSPDGALLGTGSLRRIGATEGEMKHLYVRPEARGMGLGRRLIEQRIADARAMGLKVLLADTFAANTEMPALYDKIGFDRVPPFDLSRTAKLSPELTDHMLFFRMNL